eukprot:TRINITY_DN12097_c0_g1_i2.p1 TRINITY_DN12097_c0_g1~~TRINITY_DN12097_c0_g1_i2.p1  ORF type:complete len:385 (+),score=96.36 TRINITY_DN12097_c0_g1_i2:834-1988(+)
MESYNTEWTDATSILGTLHYGWADGAGANFNPPFPNGMGSRGQNGCVLKSGISYAGFKHVFSVEWAPGSIKYYIDSLLYCEFTEWWAGEALNPRNKFAPYDQPFKLILNLAVGGTLPGAMAPADIPLNAMPMRMEFDYVRVWELTPEEMAAANPFPGPITVPTPLEDQAVAPYNRGPITGEKIPWTLYPGGTRIDAEFFDYGPQGLAYFDMTPAMNMGTSALRPYAGVEVSEDNVFIPATAFKFVDSSGAYITLDAGEWTRYSIALPYPYLEMWVEMRHSILGGGAFRLIADSYNCAAPETDGGALLLDVPDVMATFEVGDEPAIIGYQGLCWQTQRWPAQPIATGGEHYLVLCSLSDGLNVQYMDITPYEPDHELKVGPGCGY